MQTIAELLIYIDQSYQCLVCGAWAESMRRIPHTPGCWMAQAVDTLAKLPARPERVLVAVCAESIEREG